MTDEITGGRADREELGPHIDYLTKDYASFRRLILDRLTTAMPGWRERNSADLGTVLLEILAYSADHLSYFQDAVANEAYLSTARRRVSIRRHARLLDYAMHDGCNARAWVSFTINSSSSEKIIPKRSVLLTRTKPGPTLLSETEVAPLLSAGAQPFETLHDLQVFSAHNEIQFLDRDGNGSLPQGATRAVLDDTAGLRLKIGDVLIFEERRGRDSGKHEDADPERRHAVRLTRVEPALTPDPNSQRVCIIEWAAGDALPFSLRLSSSCAVGNVALVDHGYKLSAEEILDASAADGLYGLTLARSPLTQQGAVPRSGVMQTFDPEDSASAAFKFELRDACPAISLRDDSGAVWSPRRDLLSSSGSATDVIVEVDDDGRAALRFGDGVYGKPPSGRLRASYRVGNGRAGNVGAEAISQLVNQVGPDLAGIMRVRNPLPARGGTDPESPEQVRLYAAQAFRTQERAVTDDDYAVMARRHPQVRDAQASRRFTGSFYTVVLTVQRRGGLLLDASFKTELRAFLDRYRMMGQDLQIRGAVYVPLTIKLHVKVAPGYDRSAVSEALRQVLGIAAHSDEKSQGLFDPDRFTLGAKIYLSQILVAAMRVPGVLHVDHTRFERCATTAAIREREKRVITLGRLELPRIENDPSAPEHGTFELLLGGGR